jgi:hypothetical protein
MPQIKTNPLPFPAQVNNSAIVANLFSGPTICKILLSNASFWVFY